MPPGLVVSELPVPVTTPGTDPARASAERRLAARVGRHLLVLACFAVPAVVLWWHVWDGHLSSTLTCACGDAGQTVWFVAWPAYALAHGLDPLFSNAIEAPTGVNLLSNASSLPVGIVLAPVTWTVGPIAATNVALTLCPALSAWACWVACRRFVRWKVAPLLAGAMFGYSPFVVTNLAFGHIGLCLLVCPPLLVVASYEVLFGATGRRTRWGLALGGLGALQFFLSSEVLAIVAVVGVPTAVLAVLIGVRTRRLAPISELLRALGAACGLAAVLLVGPVWFFLAGPQHLRGPVWSHTSVDDDPLYGLWSAGPFRMLGTSLTRLGGYLGRRGPPPSYLGPVVLGAVLVSLVTAWRRRSAWMLAFAGVLAVWCSLGVVVWLSPYHADAVWLPWRVLGHLSVLDDVIPQRFTAIVDLCVALLIGLGVDRGRWLLEGRGATSPSISARQTPERPVPGGGASNDRRPRRGALPVGAVTRLSAVALGVVGLVVAASPWWTYQVPFATSTVVVPRWFTTQAPRLPAGTIVLALPFPFPTDGASGPMVWQAVDDMGFRLAGAYAKAPGPTGRPLADWTLPVDGLLTSLSTTSSTPAPSGTPSQLTTLRRALRAWHVDEVVVTSSGVRVRHAITILREVTGQSPRHELGAWVWTLHPGSGDV